MISGPLSYQVYSFEKRASGHKSHVRKLNKNGYVTIRHMFGIDHAFRFVVRLKELSGESYKLNSRVPSLVRMPGDLETRLCLRFTRFGLERGSERRIDCTAIATARFRFVLHSLWGFRGSSSILKPFNYGLQSVTISLLRLEPSHEIPSLNFMTINTSRHFVSTISLYLEFYIQLLVV